MAEEEEEEEDKEEREGSSRVKVEILHTGRSVLNCSDHPGSWVRPLL